MEYSYSWIKAKEIIHSLVVPLASKNLKHFPNSHELSPKAEAAPASSGRTVQGDLGQPRGQSHVWQPVTRKSTPESHSSCFSRGHSSQDFFLGRQDTELSMSLLTEGDSGVLSSLLNADLCSLRQRAGGG